MDTQPGTHHAAVARWWQHAVIYQVYPRSFSDANADGVGDLPGIVSRLDYLQSLGVDALWLSPFYLSPQVDAGYDVTDHTVVDPLFGSIEDFDVLVAQAHARGIRIIVDFIPNHCSDQNHRFREALAAPPGSSERDWFIFRDGRGEGGALPPNNWWGTDDGTAWTRVSTKGQPEQWYLHLFDKSQPDWNWEHPGVADMMDDVLRFWLDRGVDGFRVDVSHGMAKAPGLPDWNPPDAQGPVMRTDDAAARPPMWDQDHVHDIHRRFRSVLEEYGPERILVAEAWLETSRLGLYVRPEEMHQAFNFAYLVAPWSAEDLRAQIDESLQLGNGCTWVLSPDPPLWGWFWGVGTEKMPLLIWDNGCW